MTELAVISEQKRPSGFALQPADMDQAMKMADMLANSNMVPTNYKGQSGDTLVAMMMGSELGLNPIQSLQSIAVINGRPCVWGDAMLALVQNHPAFGGIEESFDEQSMAATCIVTRRKGKPHTQTYSQADATQANLWGKKGPWQQYPKRMLAMRARGFALRNQFADALLGLITTEEAYDYPHDTDQASPRLEPVQHATVVDELPAYSDEDFQTNKVAWKKAIDDGRGNAQGLLNKLSTKYSFSDEQINEIKSWEA